jgi:hypothetical protein
MSKMSAHTQELGKNKHLEVLVDVLPSCGGLCLVATKMTFRILGQGTGEV